MPPRMPNEVEFAKFNLQYTGALEHIKRLRYSNVHKQARELRFAYEAGAPSEESYKIFRHTQTKEYKNVVDPTPADQTLPPQVVTVGYKARQEVPEPGLLHLDRSEAFAKLPIHLELVLGHNESGERQEFPIAEIHPDKILWFDQSEQSQYPSAVELDIDEDSAELRAVLDTINFLDPELTV